MIYCNVYNKNWEIYNSSNFPYNKLANIKDVVRRRRTGNITYKDIICTFDTECSTINNEAVTYIWGFKIGKYIIVGRYWKEFTIFINRLRETLELNENKRLAIYVHNLVFDYKFFKDFLDSDYTVFPEGGKKLFSLTANGLEFRCSRALTNMSLKNFCEQQEGVKYFKLSGTMDYNKVIYANETLKRNDFRYFIGDLISLYDCLENKFSRDEDHDIAHVPLTMVGYVREYIKSYIDSHNKRYYSDMKKLTLDVDVYNMLNKLVSGGDCSSSIIYTNKILEDVESYDLQSSYPYVMLARDFPMSRFTPVSVHTIEEFNSNIEKYCCMFYIKIKNIAIKHIFDSLPIISVCKVISGDIINEVHGRLIEGRNIELLVTEERYKQIIKYYNIEDFEIGEFYIARKGKLPKEYRDAVYELFKKKSIIKHEMKKYNKDDPKYKKLNYAYNKAKERLNALFGMCLTEIVYNKEDVENELKRYNEKYGRFLYYAWGVWVVDCAKTSLYELADCCDLKLYWDTDCVKGIGWDYNKLNIFNSERLAILQKEDYIVTIEDTNYICGEAELDGKYELFKTLGPKQYIVKDAGKLKMTCSGVSKDGVSIINKIDDFAPGLTFGSEYAGCTSTIVDANKHYIEYKNKKIYTASSVVIKPTTFTIRANDDFLAKAFFSTWESMD